MATLGGTNVETELIYLLMQLLRMTVSPHISVATDVTIAWSVYLCVCMCRLTLVHRAKAIGQNEMPFGRDTLVVPSNTALDRGPGPSREWEIWGL